MKTHIKNELKMIGPHTLELIELQRQKRKHVALMNEYILYIHYNKF